MARRQKRLKRKLSLIRKLKAKDPDVLVKLKKLYFLYGNSEWTPEQLFSVKFTSLVIYHICVQLGWFNYKKFILTEKGIHDIIHGNYE